MKREEAQKYMTNFGNYKKYFSEETIELALKKQDVNMYTTKQTVRGGNCDYYDKKGYPVLAKGTRDFEEYKGEWHRTVRDFGVDYLVPSPYQLYEGSFLKDCIEIEFEFLSWIGLDFSAYHLDNSDNNDEIYIDCFVGHPTEARASLYVPIMALVKKDKQIIIDRMVNYFSSYYAGEDRAEFKAKALKALESPEAKSLFKVLDTLKKGNDVFTWADIVAINDKVYCEVFPISGIRDGDEDDAPWQIDDFFIALAEKYGVEESDILTYEFDEDDFVEKVGDEFAVGLPFGIDDCGIHKNGINNLMLDTL